MEFSRQECWSGLTFPSSGDVPHPGEHCRQILYHLSDQIWWNNYSMKKGRSGCILKAYSVSAFVCFTPSSLIFTATQGLQVTNSNPWSLQFSSTGATLWGRNSPHLLYRGKLRCSGHFQSLTCILLLYLTDFWWLAPAFLCPRISCCCQADCLGGWGH